MSITLQFTPEFGEVRKTDTSITFLAVLTAAEQTNGKADISLSVVIDKSASMCGEKLNTVQRASKYTFDRLRSRDRVGVITYGSSASELFPLSQASQLFKEEAARIVDSIQPGLCTNLSEGLFLGINQQSEAKFYDWDEMQCSEPPARLETQTTHTSSASSPGSSFVDLGSATYASDGGLSFADAIHVNESDAKSCSSICISVPSSFSSVSPTANQTELLQQRKVVDALSSKALSFNAARGFGGVLEACCANDEAAVLRLLESGAELPYCFGLGPLVEGWTPLHFAGFRGWRGVAAEVVRRAAGGDERAGRMVSGGDRYGRTPLSLAEEGGHGEVAVVLRGAGAEGRREVAGWREEIGAMMCYMEQTATVSGIRLMKPRADLGEGPRGLFGGAKRPPAQTLSPSALRHVFLFTDGHANQGLQDREELLGELDKRLRGALGVRVSTFGCGADHDGELLGRVARAGQGSYYFLRGEDDILAAFADALGGLLSAAAQGVSVRFEAAPGVHVRQVDTSFPTSTEQDGATVAVGEMRAEESQHLLFNVDVSSLSAEPLCSSALRLGTLRVSYVDVDTGREQEQAVECVVPLGAQACSDDAADARVSSPAVVLHRARAATVAALESAVRGRSGSQGGDRRPLREGLAVVQSAQRHPGLSGAQLAVLRHLEGDLHETARQLKLTGAGGRAAAASWSAIRSHEAQRSSLSLSGSWYANSVQLGFRATFN